MQRTPVLPDRIRAIVAPAPEEGAPAARDPFDFGAVAARVTSRLRAANGLEKLLPIGLCVLLATAALFSSLPSAARPTAQSSATPDVATVALQAAAGGARPYGVGDGPDAVSADDLYFGDGSIANTLQNRAGGSDARSFLTSYTVVSGDTIAKIAAHFGLASTTVYWANKSAIPNPSTLHVGQVLSIPPMDGLLVKIGPKDTLATLAAKYNIDPQDIVDANNLPEATVVLGEVVIIPGASGGPIPKPKVYKPAPIPTSGWFWPVGGDSYVSQYFWSGHHAIDIAAPYGTPVYAAVAGTVVYAGWRSYTGGGNVIWVKEGSKLYTTYNHLSSWSVHVGQVIRSGQVIGHIGTSGVTTGPHLHFEVWLGYPWALGNNSDAVNPCKYLAGC